ncbi:MAG: sulfatase [Fimbriimonadaceae bacterium]|nr:sulfatase [Fimbriimonadaceae bacterium]
MSEPCNVLLLSLDTLRADRLGCYGYWRNTSPHLDALAEQGVLFETCIAPFIPTFPAHTTFLSGQDVFAHRVIGQHGGPQDPVCDESVPLLAERLRDAGWYTAAADNLGRWFQRGFERYQGYQWERDTKVPWRKAEAVNGAALPVLRECLEQDKPWFCFLHYWDPHTPYLPPPPFDRMFYSGDEKDPHNHSADRMWSEYDALRDYFRSWMPGVTDIEFPAAQYDAEIAYMDSCLQHLWQFLEDEGCFQDTLVMITADHGEELTEHEMWYDHHGLYDTNLHVPLIMLHPELPADERLGGMVTHLDLVPTVLDACGLAVGDELPGRSLLPLVEAGADTGSVGETYLIESTWMKKYGWRTNEWKLIIDIEDPHHGTPPVELYHLPTDPDEQQNLAATHPEIVTALRTRCEAHRERRVAATGRPDPLLAAGIAIRKIGNPEAAVPEDPRRKQSGA